VATDISNIGVPTEKAEGFWNVVRMNISSLNDLQMWWDLMEQGTDPQIEEQDREFVLEAIAMLPVQPFSSDTWSIWTKLVQEATGRKGKNLFMPLRRALTGMSHGPDMGALLPYLKNIKDRI
jgi:glutamyl-tRNA synthetase